MFICISNTIQFQAYFSGIHFKTFVLTITLPCCQMIMKRMQGKIRILGGLHFAQITGYLEKQLRSVKLKFSMLSWTFEPIFEYLDELLTGIVLPFFLCSMLCSSMCTPEHKTLQAKLKSIKLPFLKDAQLELSDYEVCNYTHPYPFSLH